MIGGESNVGNPAVGNPGVPCFPESSVSLVKFDCRSEQATLDSHQVKWITADLKLGDIDVKLSSPQVEQNQ